MGALHEQDGRARLQCEPPRFHLPQSTNRHLLFDPVHGDPHLGEPLRHTGVWPLPRGQAGAQRENGGLPRHPQRDRSALRVSEAFRPVQRLPHPGAEPPGHGNGRGLGPGPQPLGAQRVEPGEVGGAG